MSESNYREASREQWSDAAASWARAAEEEETGASGDATAWMLEAADLQPGQRVLELARHARAVLARRNRSPAGTPGTGGACRRRGN